MDIIAKVEKHLNEVRIILSYALLSAVNLIYPHDVKALVRVTAASNETIQDGYLYYYACLKLAEYKMLSAACNTELHELGLLFPFFIHHRREANDIL